MLPRILHRLTCSSIRCAAALPPGPACASICRTCRRSCARRRNRWIPTLSPSTQRASALRTPRAKNLLEVVSARDFELVVTAIGRAFIRAPPQKRGGMAKAVALQMIVLDLAHALDPQGLPGKILAPRPAALRPRHARRLIV